MFRISNFIIFITFFSIFFGNFFRIIPFDNLIQSLNLFEVLIPLITIFLIPFVYSNKKIPHFIIITICLFLLSIIVGIFKFGFFFNSFAYNIQFCLYLVFSHLLGLSLYKNYGNDINKFMIRYIGFNYYLVLFSILIFISFPDSSELYYFLSKYNIIYHGDAHSGRVISPFLEPNLFSLYLVLPIYLLIGNSNFTKRKQIFLLVLFLICLLLTKSRSGIGTLFILIFIDQIFIFLKFIYDKKIKFNLSKLVAYFLMFTFVVYFIYLTDVHHRFLVTFQDYSSLARFKGFDNFFTLLNENLLIGVGFNNTVMLSANLGNNIDSALMVMILSFGILTGLPYIFYLCYFIINIHMKLKSNISCSFYSKKLIKYFFVIFLITGNFNLIFFEYFFIIPIFGIFFYINIIAKRNYD